MWSIKNCLIRLISVALAIGIAFLLATLKTSVLPVSIAQAREESRSYFVTSPTVYAREQGSISPFDLPFVQGEKVQYVCEDEGGREVFVKALLARFSAFDVWEEEVDGVKSYYASSAYLPKKVVVDGHTVNLHIALPKDKKRAVVGTPIIFGGY
ncbi:MAG: hypothetical protein IKC37_01955 [Clostridia bacterium]|nr:hypothetical protein [Clostridia bacterium]